jgi:all-trans-retinol 13,14-reductase
MKNSAHVLIIGSGISALTAGAFLSKKGFKVTLLEKYLKPGGYMHSFKRFGLHFETGAHYVGSMGPGQLFRRILENLGVDCDKCFRPMDSVYEHVEVDGRVFGLHKGVKETQEKLIDIFPEQQDSIRKYFDCLKQCQEFAVPKNLSDMLTSDVWLKMQSQTVSRVMDSLNITGYLRELLSLYNSLHGISPDDASFAQHALASYSIFEGPYSVTSGDLLAENLLREIKAHGGTLLTNKKVRRLIVENRIVKGVECESGETFIADYFISSIHPRNFLEMLDEDVPTPAFRQRIEKLDETVSVMGFYAKVRGPNPFKLDRNYWISDNGSSHEVYKGQSDISNFPDMMYIPVPNKGAESSTHFPLTVHAPLPYKYVQGWQDTKWKKRPEDYEQFKTKLAERIIRRLDEKFPGLGARIEAYEVSTPLTNIHFNGSFQGSAFGIYQTVAQTGIARLGPRCFLKNLALVGQNTLISGLMPSAITGVLGAGLIAGWDESLKVLREERIFA